MASLGHNEFGALGDDPFSIWAQIQYNDIVLSVYEIPLLK